MIGIPDYSNNELWIIGEFLKRHHQFTCKVDPLLEIGVEECRDLIMHRSSKRERERIINRPM